jgi:hypothetical protein
MRMTIDLHENELKQNRFLVDKFAEIIKAMGAKEVAKQYRTAPYDITVYQTTHLNGGAVMGADPKSSAINRYLAKLGRAQPVRARRERISAERWVQPDRNGGGARVLGGRCNP